MERNEKLKTNAQTLRKNMTKEEAKLWYQFLCRYPLQFRRQYVVGSYITDFYCHQAKLVVELDGSQHYTPEMKEYDEKRTAYLQSLGLCVLRFSNLDVMRRFRGICEAIDMTVKERTEKNIRFRRSSSDPASPLILIGRCAFWHITAVINPRISSSPTRPSPKATWWTKWSVPILNTP